VATGADLNHPGLADPPDPRLWGSEPRPRFLGSVSEPNSLGSDVRTQG